MYVFWHSYGDGLMLMPQSKEEREWLESFEKILNAPIDEEPKHFREVREAKEKRWEERRKLKQESSTESDVDNITV